MLSRTLVGSIQIRQTMAAMVGRVTIMFGSKPHRSHYGTSKSGADLRCNQSILEHSNAADNGLWHSLGSTPIEAEIKFVEELLAFCRVLNPQAKANAALQEFGSIPKFLDASKWRLKRLGIDSSRLNLHISMIKNSLDHYLKPRSVDPLEMKTFNQLKDYLVFHHGHLNTEHARVLFLDCQNGLIDDQMLNKGTHDQCAIYVRSIVHKAMDLGAAAIILVHNHPSGTIEASRQDIQVTRDICAACRKLGIAVHDHLIISGTKHYSFRSHGLM